MLNKKSPDIQKQLDEMNNDFISGREYHEVDGIILDNHKKRLEIRDYPKMVKQRNIAIIISIIACLCTVITVLLLILQKK